MFYAKGLFPKKDFVKDFFVFHHFFYFFPNAHINSLYLFEMYLSYVRKALSAPYVNNSATAITIT